MSSVSSFSSEASSSSSSSTTKFLSRDAQLNSDVLTTDTSSRLDAASSRDTTESGFAKSGSPRLAGLGIDAAADVLLRRERIHRYVDQCVAPDLLEHQRATDGRVLVELCEALVELGGPEVWSTRLPSDIFDGSVPDYQPLDIDTVRGKSESDVPDCVANKALYCSEEVPAPCEAGSPAAMVSWESFADHLMDLTSRLVQLIGRGDSFWPHYTLPPRLQARVTPVLYGWATHWPLAAASQRCWKAVVKAFHATSKAHSPRKDALPGSPVAASPASSAAPSPVTEEPVDDGTSSEAGGRGRYTFTLAWKPLARLFLAVLTTDNSRLLSWNATTLTVRRELPALCRHAAPFFSADAVDGLWGLTCGELQRTRPGAAALSLFVQLVPYRHLCEPATNATPLLNGASAGGAADQPPRLTSRAKQLLRFFLVDALGWSPLAPPDPLAGKGRSGRKKERAARLLMPWKTAVMFFVSSLAVAHPAAEGLDDYAEPLFTSWLRALALPIHSAAGLTGATAAAAVSRVVRAAGGNTGSSVGGSGGGSGGGQRVAAELSSTQLEWTAAPYVRLLSAFPDNTESPLWRQLERWLHATSVLVRPGLPCSPGSAAARVCECYCRLAREALRRVPRKQPRVGEAGTTVLQDAAVLRGASENGSVAGASRASTRYWSTATIDKFVQLFLPLAVSAFQTRARLAADFLISLLYMSPTIALPSLLKCVDTGLQSPTEVGEQRRISAVLLMHTIVTVFTDDGRFGADVARAARDAVTEYFQECLVLFLSLLSPSTPEVSHSVLMLLSVAANYIPTATWLRSSYEAESLGTEFAARVIPLFTEQAVEKGQAHAPQLKHIEAFIAALPPSATTMVARAVLRESQNRDHGGKMSELVRMVAVVCPAEAWKCAEAAWLPLLLDAAATDTEVEWAGGLLAAAVVELGDRATVRQHAGELFTAAQAQLRFLTSKRRRAVAMSVVSAVVASLLRLRATAATAFCAPRWPSCDDGSPLSPSPSSTSPTAPPRLTGTATDARVVVERPTEADVRAAVDFFDGALRDVVAVVKGASRVRVCAPATAAAATAPTLAARFVDVDGDAAAATTGKDGSVCESASTVSPQTVLEGALDVLHHLLEIFEWYYVEPSPPVESGPDTNDAVAAAKRGVHWSAINPRSAWRPVRALVDCKPAYSRNEIFDLVYTYVCLPLVEHHVKVPLAKAGVDLTPYLRALLPSIGASSSSSSSSDDEVAMWGEEASVVDWTCVSKVLHWLVMSDVGCPQHRWLPEETFFHVWSKLTSHNPTCRSRKRMPISAWASRALRLHVEAAVAGYLPVSQETLSRTVSVLQCLSLAPRETVRLSSIHLFFHLKVFKTLNRESLRLFLQRQHALSAVVLARWAAQQQQQQGRGVDVGDVAVPLATSDAVVHALQESCSGTVQLFALLTMHNLLLSVPWMSLHALTALVNYPEGLRTMSTARLLPLLQKRYDALLPVDSLTSRSPPYLEHLVQLASSLASAHPTRAVVLLTQAQRLYWPSARQPISLAAVRQLARLSLSVHVEVRSRATRLLGTVAAFVPFIEPRQTVRLVARSPSDATSPQQQLLLLSPPSSDDADEARQQQYGAVVRELQASLARLKAALPQLPRYLEDRGQVFPLSTLTVPMAAAAAAGLQVVTPDDFASEQGSCIDTPNFVTTLACDSTAEQEAYREQWSELLLGGGGAAPAPWVGRLLTLPIERPLAGVAQEAPPATLVCIVASTRLTTAAAAQRVDDLLAWAEQTLQQWQDSRPTRRHADVGAAADDEESRVAVVAAEKEGEAKTGTPMEVAAEAGMMPPAGPRTVAEDELYRLFLSVSTVATAVVQLTAKAPSGQSPALAEVSAALRRRALQLFVSVLTCLCSHAAVPHLVMRSMMVFAISMVGWSISEDETWRVLSSVSDTLKTVSAAAASHEGEKKEEEEGRDGSHDMWSQRQLRLLMVMLTLLQFVPHIVTSALLPRLVELVLENKRLFFMSPADQVRQCTSDFLSQLLRMSFLNSTVIVEFSQCLPSARTLFSLLLREVNTVVFDNKLPLSTASLGNNGGDAAAAERGNVPLPVFSAPSPDGLALLTTVALTIQRTPMEVFLDFTKDALVVLCYSLDFSFTQAQHLHEAAEAALEAVVMSWRPKAAAHALLEQLCAICTGAVPYGVSRRARAVCTRALRLVVFRNLHRIGKYAMMLQVSDAALASLANRDAGVRGEGSQLFAILTKVASEAQTRVMVQALGMECRELTRKAAALTPTPPPSSPPPPPAPAAAAAEAAEPETPSTVSESAALHTRRFAVVQALGAVVLADPGTPSPYVPKLMEALASCAREGNTECGRFAKRVFEQWWHAHREGWEQEYKRYFTPEQVDSMTDLLFAPRYYA